MKEKWGSDKLICSKEGRWLAQGHSTSYWTADFLSAPPMPCPPCPKTSSDSLRGPWTEGSAIWWESQSRALALLSPPTWRWFICGDELTHSACSDHHSCLLFLKTWECHSWRNLWKLPWGNNFKDFLGSPNKRKPVLFLPCWWASSSSHPQRRCRWGPAALTMEPGGYGVGVLLVARSQG